MLQHNDFDNAHLLDVCTCSLATTSLWPLQLWLGSLVIFVEMPHAAVKSPEAGLGSYVSCQVAKLHVLLVRHLNLQPYRHLEMVCCILKWCVVCRINRERDLYLLCSGDWLRLTCVAAQQVVKSAFCAVNAPAEKDTLLAASEQSTFSTSTVIDCSLLMLTADGGGGGRGGGNMYGGGGGGGFGGGGGGAPAYGGAGGGFNACKLCCS